MIFKVMRFVLFYSDVESFNYFTDRIVEELNKKNHECFVLDLRDMSESGEHSFERFNSFLEKKADVAIAFDGLGIKDRIFVELWDSMNILAINILMDHPLRFHPTMLRHPRRYIQFCCDRNHVEYVKKYFGESVADVRFMPHAGTYMGEPDLENYEKRPYDVLFSGTFYEPHIYLEQIDEMFSDNELIKMFYHNLADYMTDRNEVSTEQAVVDVMDLMRLIMSEKQVIQLFRFAEPVDWLARMYYRKQIVQMIADSGIDLWLLGRGWENHPAAMLDNVHIINDRIPFKDTLPIMAKAKINLNIMPWFKDGTHDRIFNILLQGSLPLTDKSKWLEDNFTDNENIVFYDLNELDSIPEIIKNYLDNPEKSKEIIKNGFNEVADKYTWTQITEQILACIE